MASNLGQGQGGSVEEDHAEICHEPENASTLLFPGCPSHLGEGGGGLSTNLNKFIGHILQEVGGPRPR